MISAFNMSGRFLWASASDYLGRKRTYFVFFGLGIPLYLTIPAAAAWASGAGAASVLPLALFYGSTMVIFTSECADVLVWPCGRTMTMCVLLVVHSVRWRLCDDSGILG